MSTKGYVDDLEPRVETVTAGQGEEMDRISPGLLLIWLAPLAASGVAYVADADLRLPHPLWLLVACIWLMWPGRSRSVKQVQNVVFLYLVWVVLGACFDVSWAIQGLGHLPLRVSSTVLVVGLIGLGHVLHRQRQATIGQTWRFTGSAPVWAVAVVCAHAAFLAVLLCWVYGFGWEEDWAVLGRMSFCVIVLMGMLPVVEVFVLRASLSLALAMLLLAKGLA